MERLGASSPSIRLSAEQKARLAELDSIYKAKIAQEDLSCRDEVSRLEAAGAAEEARERHQLYLEQKKRLEAELEEKKERVRGS